MLLRNVAGSLLVVTVILTAGLMTPSPAASAASSGVVAWGYNGDGQLGIGTTSKSDTAVAVKDLGTVTAVAAGGYHSLALLKNGTVMAWGFNKHGQLGNDATGNDGAVPATVRKLSQVIAISAGTFDSLALLSNGTVMAWGENVYGDLGDGTTTGSDVPVAVCAVGATAPCSAGDGNALSGVIAISAGGSHSLALLRNGTVVAWGENDHGELGDGTATTMGADVPVVVRGLSAVTAISAGGNHNLALLANGAVKAWGSNDHGQLGTDSTDPSSDVVVPVKSLKDVTAVSAGAQHSLALLANGTVRAWGLNNDGQLGDGTIGKESKAARPVTTLSGVTAISAGADYSLALLDDGTVMAWGSNEWGALGIATTQSTKSDMPESVPGLSAVSAISAGAFHSLAEEG
jgi:alpha-tubulin suppressor-like RCC1 family protein